MRGGLLDRVPSVVRRPSSATPVPVVNETFFLLLSGLFQMFHFLCWAWQYWYSVDLALAAFGLRDGLFFSFRYCAVEPLV